MLHVTICDDDKFFLERISGECKKILEKSVDNIEIHTFLDGKQVLEMDEDQEESIFIIDIEMPDMDGFVLAEEIRKKHKSAFLIFCTSHKELVYSSFDYEPFWFLCKDNYSEHLEKVLKKVLQKIEEEKREYVFNINGEFVVVKIAEILYIDVYLHKITVHLMDGSYFTYRGRISDIEKEFSQNRFVKINSGCLVNLLWIRKVKENEIQLKNGELLSVSRSNTKNVRDCFLEYVRERK